MKYINIFLTAWVVIYLETLDECIDFLKTFPEKGYVLDSVRHEEILHPYYRVVYWDKEMPEVGYD